MKSPEFSVTLICYVKALKVEIDLILQGIPSTEFVRHLRLACKRGFHAGRLVKNGIEYSMAEGCSEKEEDKVLSYFFILSFCHEKATEALCIGRIQTRLEVVFIS